MKYKKGDTLIEVTLAIGVFSMIAIAVVSVMNTGTSGVQSALETTLAREEIDAQAEALRFIQASYISDKDSERTDNGDKSVSFDKIWEEITGLAVEPSEAVANYSPKSCKEAYSDSALSKAFIINTKQLGNYDTITSGGYSGDSLLLTMNSSCSTASGLDGKCMKPASTYPRLIYRNTYNEPEEDLINTQNNGNSYYVTPPRDKVYSAEGIYIIAVKDEERGTTISGDGGILEQKSAFYDFYIRTCWYSSGANTPSTISTVIRLYDPKLIKPNEGIIAVDFDPNYEGAKVERIRVKKGKSFDLPSPSPRPGFKFDGWEFGGNLYKAGDSFTTNTMVMLKAVWTPKLAIDDAEFLQDVTKEMADAAGEGYSKTLKDKRDNKGYLVKIINGRLWLLDNLALDLTNPTILNGMDGSNTNASDTTLNYLKNGGGTASDKYAINGVTSWTTGESNSDPLANLAYKDTVSSDPIDQAGHYKIGGYYNYCAASAGSYCYGNGTSYGISYGNATEDICPKGWRMPTGSSSGDFSALANSIYGSTEVTYDTITVANYRTALHLPLSGYFGYSDLQQGRYGGWWSSTRYDSRMHGLFVRTDLVNPTGASSRSNGFTIRCILAD